MRRSTIQSRSDQSVFPDVLVDIIPKRDRFKVETRGFVIPESQVARTNYWRIPYSGRNSMLPNKRM